MNAPSDGGSGYSVRPEEVTKLGKKAEELGSRLVNLVRATVEESTAAAQAHQDWAFAGPLESLQRSCEHKHRGVRALGRRHGGPVGGRGQELREDR